MSRKVLVVAPTFNLRTAVGQVKPDNPFDPSLMRLTGASLSGIPVVAGTVWGGVVTTPTEFGTGGGWNFTQTVIPYRVIKSPGKTHNWSGNNQLGLDEQFGYGIVNPGLHPADGSSHAAWDSPFQGFDTRATKIWTDVEANDTYAVYVMYKPPGDGSNFVPLRAMVWYWKGQAKVGTSGKWEIYNELAKEISTVTYPSHPKWTYVHHAAQGYWTPALP